MDQIILTQEGLDKLKKELATSLVKRKIIADKIEYAKSLGDLSENFEYQEAKEDQSFNETRILEVQDMIKRAVIGVVAEKGIVSLGSTIEVEAEGKKHEYTLVSFNEADPVNGKISNESPLGQAFLGKQVGETVEVRVPRGVIKYKVLKVK